MRPTAAALLVAALVPAKARFTHSLPEDAYAFPKFSVVFLNGLPVLNNTAERWLADGLLGGEPEFLDQVWEDSHSTTQGIESGQSSGALVSQFAVNTSLTHMRMGPSDSYVCLIPEPLTQPPQEEDDERDVTPAHTWSLLQPLAGTCLYHRQGWFTYSYCHNDEIRQFKELIPKQGVPIARKPEEDPEWESYTLGRAANAPVPEADLTVAEQNTVTANLELARTAGSRYLVQKWGDGTKCDKTGTRREVEVQFHCSMTMTDTILFVKETKTCSYLLVIHTPRLCGEPGFRSRREAGNATQIRCREVVDTLPEKLGHLIVSENPMNVPMRKTILPPPLLPEEKEKNKDQLFNDLFRQTLVALLEEGGSLNADLENTDEIILDIDPDDLPGDRMQNAERLVDALQKVGFDVQTKVVRAGKTRDINDYGEGDAENKEIPKKTGYHGNVEQPPV